LNIEDVLTNGFPEGRRDQTPAHQTDRLNESISIPTPDPIKEIDTGATSKGERLMFKIVSYTDVPGSSLAEVFQISR
jgi:hypothetical protein